jgi:hypothetical protein
MIFIRIKKKKKKEVSQHTCMREIFAHFGAAEVSPLLTGKKDHMNTGGHVAYF